MRKSIFRNWDKHQKKWYGKWHLYLGIIAGVIVAIVGITGSILVFRDEIDHALNPQLFQSFSSKPRLPIDAIYEQFHQKHPEVTVNYIYQPDQNPNASIIFYDYAKEKQFFVNPFNGDLCGSRLYESGFVNFAMNIHRTLLIPKIGQYVVGIASLILIILTISGIRLWIPKKWKKIKEVLTVKMGANWKRQNYDWHNVLGIYSAPVVVMLALTGFCITFYLPIVGITFSLSGKDPVKASKIYSLKSDYKKGVNPLSLKDAFVLGNKVFSNGKILGVALASDSTSSYRLDVITPSISKEGKREMVVLDQYSGKVLASSKDFPQVASGLLSWMQPIHYGTFGGMPTRILALIGGLIPAALLITGFIIWWPRWKKQRHKTPSLKKKGEEIPRTPSFVYFGQNLKKGFKYALLTSVIAGVCGAIYGLIAGIVAGPAAYAIIFLVPIIGVNFLVSFATLIINWIVLLPFKKSHQPIYRYFAISLSFMIVFLPLYYLLMHSGMKLF